MVLLGFVGGGLLSMHRQGFLLHDPFSTLRVMAFDVFISYPHQNKAVADAACATLEASDIRCWIAPRDVPPGAEWAGAIVDAIDQCRAMVLIFSSSTNGSKQIHREVQRAFDREKPVVPFRIENVTPEKSLAYYMGPVHWLDALTPPLEQHLERLATSVGALIGVSPAERDVQEAQTARVEREAREKVAPAERRAAAQREQVEAEAGLERGRREIEEWTAASRAGDAAAFAAFLKEWPQSQHAKAALARIKELKGPTRRRVLKRLAIAGGLAVIGGGTYVSLYPGFPLWRLLYDQSVRTFTGHESKVNSVAFSPDGRTLLSASSDGTLKLWEVATGKEIRTFRGRSGGERSVAFSPDGKTALSGGEALRLWEVATGKELRTFVEYSGGFNSVAFSPDGRTALTGDTPRLWDVATGAELPTLLPKQVAAIVLSPDGRTALSGEYGGDLKLWDVPTGKELRTFTEERTATDYWAVHSVAFSPDGTKAVACGQTDTENREGALKMWDTATGKKLHDFYSDIYGKHLASVLSIAFSPDSRMVFFGSRNGSVTLREAVSGLELRTFTGHRYFVNSVAFAPDGGTAISGSTDATVKLWDLTGL